MTEKNYPTVLYRVKAIVFDSVFIILFLFAMFYIFSMFKNVPENAIKVISVFIFILYDPLFTSLFGGTIGHMMVGVRVKRESNEQKNIFFHLAVLRFIFKAFLSWISLITVSFSKKKIAIHDYLVGSVVVYAKPIEETESSFENND